jgi:hypothetical protein
VDDELVALHGVLELERELALLAEAAVEGVARRAPTARVHSRFAAYIAVSALRISSSAVPRAGPVTAIPTLAWILASLPMTENVVFSLSPIRLRRVLRSAHVGVLEQDGELVAAEPGGHVARADLPTEAVGHLHSSSSPGAWPQLSLMFLKWSRSRKRTAWVVPAVVLPGERLGHLVGEEHRFGKPVSASW